MAFPRSRLIPLVAGFALPAACPGTGLFPSDPAHGNEPQKPVDVHLFVDPDWRAEVPDRTARIE